MVRSTSHRRTEEVGISAEPQKRMTFSQRLTTWLLAGLRVDRLSMGLGLQDSSKIEKMVIEKHCSCIQVTLTQTPNYQIQLPS